jgi:hypothetical protein
MRLAWAERTVARMDAPAAPESFGAGRLFLADSRIALAALNEVRYMALTRLFGVSRDQVNILTLVLAVGAGDAAYETARRMRHVRIPLSRNDAVIGGFALREAGYAVAGRSGGDTPLLGTLLAVAILGGLAAPGIRTAGRNLRAAERRLRLERIRRYLAAGGARPG